MSTKNLSRTVIEGGRRNVYERRKTSKDLRAAERAYLTKVRHDVENWDEEAEPDLQPEGKEFSDKLSPMYRWLDSKVGESWADVRSAVFNTFDTRTTAGRHITFDHLLREVVDTISGFDKYGHMTNPNILIEKEGGKRRYRVIGGYNDYYVDENDVLCKHNSLTRKYYRRPYPSQEELQAVALWLDGSIIGKKDNKLYWFAATEGIWRAEWEKEEYGYSSVLHYCLWDKGEHKVKRISTLFGKPYSYTVKEHGSFWNPIETPFSYRQRGPLTDKDLKYFNSLNERVRAAILSFGAGR